MIKVYIRRREKQDASWERILEEILKKDYQMKECPEIVRDALGKPYLKNGRLHFNVSHSGKYLAIAVSESPVGIDIQETKNIRDGMYRKIVQPKEQALIGKDRQKDFLRLWTLKESFVKAEGKGLRIPMRDYYFEKKNDRYFVNYGGQKAPWAFKIEETLVKGYVISVCGLEPEVSWNVQ